MKNLPRTCKRSPYAQVHTLQAASYMYSHTTSDMQSGPVWGVWWQLWSSSLYLLSWIGIWFFFVIMDCCCCIVPTLQLQSLHIRPTYIDQFILCIYQIVNFSITHNNHKLLVLLIYVVYNTCLVGRIGFYFSLFIANTRINFYPQIFCPSNVNRFLTG